MDQVTTYIGCIAAALLFVALIWRMRGRLAAERCSLTERLQRLEGRIHTLMEQRLGALDDAKTARVRSVRDLAAGVAHEINTPLGALRSTLDLVTRAARRVADGRCGGDGVGGDRARMQRALRTLERVLPLAEDAVGRIDDVVQQLARFSHLDRADQVPADIRAGLEVTLGLLRPPDGDPGDGLRLRLDLNDVPPVMGTPVRLNLAFLNLLLNAAEAVDWSGEVSVGCRSEGDEVVVTVRDHGRGIPEHALERVFEPGFSCGSGRDRPGLGMPIARRIVEEHHGKITIQSRLGEGTTVEVRLPVQDARAGAPRKERPAAMARMLPAAPR